MIVDRELFAQLWLAGASVPEIASRVGCHQPAVYSLRVKFGLPRRPRVPCTNKDPSPEEVEGFCRLAEAVQPHAANPDPPVDRTFDLDPHAPERGDRGEAVRSLQKSGDFRDALGEGAKHDGTVGNRLVSGHAQMTTQTAAVTNMETQIESPNRNRNRSIRPGSR